MNYILSIITLLFLLQTVDSIASLNNLSRIRTSPSIFQNFSTQNKSSLIPNTSTDTSNAITSKPKSTQSSNTEIIINNKSKTQNFINQLDPTTRINLRHYLMNLPKPGKPAIINLGKQSYTISPQSIKLFAEMLTTDTPKTVSNLPNQETSLVPLQSNTSTTLAQATRKIKPPLQANDSDFNTSLFDAQPKEQALTEPIILTPAKTSVKPILDDAALDFEMPQNDGVMQTTHLQKIPSVQPEQNNELTLNTKQQDSNETENNAPIVHQPFIDRSLISHPIFQDNQPTTKKPQEEGQTPTEKTNPTSHETSTLPVLIAGGALSKMNQLLPKTTRTKPLVTEKQIELSKTEAKFIENIVDSFDKKIFHTMTKTFFKSKKYKIDYIEQNSLNDVIKQKVKVMIFKILKLPKSIRFNANNDNSLLKLEAQLTDLINLIEKYNQTSIYNNLDQMLMFLKYTQNFILTSNILYLPQDIHSLFDKINQVATTCYTICQSQPMVFTNNSTPATLQNYFKIAIDNTYKLNNVTYNQTLINNMYDKKGYMQTILQTWQNFKQDELYQTEKLQQYGAFLTFLLIFENSLVVLATMIDTINQFYQLGNLTPVEINIT